MKSRRERGYVDLVGLIERVFEPAALDDLLGGASSPSRAVWERALLGPARAFLAHPGKAFRARLVEAGFELGGGGAGTAPAVLPFLVELLHAGSLIIDDIEDGSTERRGQPALHVRHGVPLALNTGNWLYFLPSALLERAGFPAAIELALHRALDRTLIRCHHGQALDLSVRVWDTARADLPGLVESIARLKTGSLVELAVVLGAIAAGADPADETALATFGKSLGTALQGLDDLGGLRGRCDPGKRHEDLRLGRPTFIWATLARGPISDAGYQSMLRRAEDTAAGADPAPLAADLLSATGESARAQVRTLLASALLDLGDALGAARVRGLAAEIVRLEEAYG